MTNSTSKLSEPVLTPFQSVPIWTLITHLPCLTSISLYRFWYLRSGPACPFSPHCSLDLVVCFPCSPFQTFLCRYHRPALNPRWTLFICLLLSHDLPQYVSHTTPFPFWTFISIHTYATFSATLRVSCTIPFCSFAYVPLFQFHTYPSRSDL